MCTHALANCAFNWAGLQTVLSASRTRHYTSAALWRPSQKLALTPLQSLEILPRREKPAAEASSPAGSALRAGKDSGSGLLSDVFWRSAGYSCQSPPGCLAGPAGCCSPLAQLGQPQGTVHCPKALVKWSPRVVQSTPAVLSDARKRVVLAKPETGILSNPALLFALHHHVQPDLHTHTTPSPFSLKYFCSGVWEGCIC